MKENVTNFIYLTKKCHYISAYLKCGVNAGRSKCKWQVEWTSKGLINADSEAHKVSDVENDLIITAIEKRADLIKKDPKQRMVLLKPRKESFDSRHRVSVDYAVSENVQSSNELVQYVEWNYGAQAELASMEENRKLPQEKLDRSLTYQVISVGTTSIRSQVRHDTCSNQGFIYREAHTIFMNVLGNISEA